MPKRIMGKEAARSARTRRRPARARRSRHRVYRGQVGNRRAEINQVMRAAWAVNSMAKISADTGLYATAWRIPPKANQGIDPARGMETGSELRPTRRGRRAPSIYTPCHSRSGSNTTLCNHSA